MRPPARMVRSTAALALLVLLSPLASCSDEPDQPGTLPTAESSSGSPSATPSPSTAEQEVEAAVRNYYAVLTRAAQTNDTSELKELTTTGCPCYRPVRVIRRNAQEGRTTPDAVFAIDSLRVHDIEDGTAVAEVRTSESAYDVLDRSGEVVGRVPARSQLLDLSLVRTSAGRWVIGNEFNLEGA